MPLPKIEDARQLSNEKLEEQILAVKRELFQLRFKQGTRQQGVQPHQFRHARHRLAQLMTVERERQLQGQNAAEAEE